MENSLMSFVEELKRRNVFRVAIANVVIAWLILQVGDTLAPLLLYILHKPADVAYQQGSR